MSEVTFSEEALKFYSDMRNVNYSTDKYNLIKPIFHQEIKPTLFKLLQNLSTFLASEIPELTFDPNEDLGSPFPNGQAAKYAWGAITRLGKTKHTDLQFYVAMRFDYLRFGIYASQKHATSAFGEIYRAILNDTPQFLEHLENLERKGITLTRMISNDETGKPQKLSLNPKFVADDLMRDGSFNVMTAIPLEELSGTNVFPSIADAFKELVPMYCFVLGL